MESSVVEIGLGIEALVLPLPSALLCSVDLALREPRARGTELVVGTESVDISSEVLIFILLIF